MKTATNQKSHSYRGHKISRTTSTQSKRWYIESIHTPTGIPMDESLCAQAYTLAQAKEHIDHTEAHR